MAFPTGVDFKDGSIRIRFMWNGRRRSEILAYPQTPQGLQLAASLRTQVVQLAKLGLLTDAKYAELFPTSSYHAAAAAPLFGEYSQAWLNSREIVEGTRKNYLWAFNTYWMPHLALRPIDEITPTLLRKIVGDTQWPSPGVKRNALTRLGSVLRAAVKEGLLPRDPTELIDKPKLVKKIIDPFTKDEADQIIAHLYANLSEFARSYAAYFEFAFYTGMRPSEIMALRWDEVDLPNRAVHVCRVVAQRKIHERTKTKKPRIVLLNERALHALEVARAIRLQRARRKMAFPDSPYVFPPAKGHAFIQESSVTDKHFKLALAQLGLRDRPQYNCRHTYATMCLMADMKPAFIASQLGHSVQMLLSTYARWLNSASDWREISKLDADPKNEPNGPILVRLENQPL